MSARARILAIRLSERVRDNPDVAQELGISVNLVSAKERVTDAREATHDAR